MWNVLAAIIAPLADWLKGRDADRPREAALRRLLRPMGSGLEWRTIETLSVAIGADEAETTRLLLRIGAHRSTGKRNVWTITSDRPR